MAGSRVGLYRMMDSRDFLEHLLASNFIQSRLNNDFFGFT